MVATAVWVVATVVLAGCAPSGAGSGDASRSSATPELSPVASRVTQLLGAVDQALGTTGPGPRVELSAADPALAETGLAAVTVSTPGAQTRLIVNPDLIAGMEEVTVDALLAHELVHVRMQPITEPTTALWIVEGFADLIGFQIAGVDAETLRASAAFGGVPTARPSDVAFQAEGAVRDAAYAQAFLLWRVIADRAGLAGCIKVYSASVSQPDAAAFDQAVLAATGLDREQIDAVWRERIEKGRG